MRALASPSVGIVHGDSVLHFTRKPSDGGGLPGYQYAPVLTPLAEQTERPHESLIDVGLKWQLIPERLYGYEYRRDYLRSSYPNVSDEVGVAPVPSIGALGVFERSPGIPAGVDADHHFCELLLAAGEASVALATPHAAIAFFTGAATWVAVYRDGQLVHAQGQASSDPADVVFLLAALLQQFGIERDATSLLVGGAVNDEGLLMRELKVYFDARPLIPVCDANLPATQLLVAYERALRSGLYPLPAPSKA